ncbi:MAG: hypothetical protein ABJQ85_10440 [Rhizobiaceae bacterium]
MAEIGTCGHSWLVAEKQPPTGVEGQNVHSSAIRLDVVPGNCMSAIVRFCQAGGIELDRASPINRYTLAVASDRILASTDSSIKTRNCGLQQIVTGLCEPKFIGVRGICDFLRQNLVNPAQFLTQVPNSVRLDHSKVSTHKPFNMFGAQSQVEFSEIPWCV